jgi:hypothetical protein
MYNPDELPTAEDLAFLLDCFNADQQQLPQEEERHVRFAPVVTSAPPATNPLAFEDLKEFWYSADELGQFKMQARNLVRGGHKSTATSGEEESLRGFEHTNPLRQRHRRMTIRCTVSAARQGLRGEQLESVARKCTQWNADIALMQACHDFAIVYKPQMVIARIPPAGGENPPAFPFAVKSSSSSKRCYSNDNNTDAATRNVRQRVTLQ